MLVLIAPRNAVLGVIVMVIAFVLFESVLRRTFATTMGSLAVTLALITAIVLVMIFWKRVLIGALAGVALILLFQKVRELRG